ncbi:SGNH/GDSL hydrolase family protein [Streptomyces sp. DSM 44915]|uniref:SGNH/GDSL hydrolase family protein n=1 Tax=Streptomyces chisholmiae TaxID=3075540 RepID=A0ABU2JM30_9ACTN|nr:SGNH/GDSL hydrolase family protein [Streptomyces sp. DSM 44915]MDT0266030.1 SGNH/GDSL hydrolase family protein [Streptomyces sp. DSM 44915]
MNARRCLTVAVTTAAVLGVTALTPTAAQATASPTAAVDYVALGDSYSSGVGAGSYDDASGDCKRSTVAYPELWADANAPDSFAFAACSGAVTSDLINEQVGALSAATTLVSVSIGGNDAGFADTMQTCVLQGTEACLAAVAEANEFAQATLPGRLDDAYQAITGAAPNAEVVVLGYPRFYELDGSCVLGISEESRAAINDAADQLSAVISDRAASHGFTYGDVRQVFTGHEICSADEWLHSVTVPIGDSYHPTAEGQSGGYYAVFESLA